MKKIIISLLVLITSGFVFALAGLNLLAKDDLINLYPRGDENFETTPGIGNSNWVMEYHGHRLFNSIQSVTHVSTFDQNFYDEEGNVIDKPEEKKVWFKGVDVPRVANSNNGGVIVNDKDYDITIDTSTGTARADIGSAVTSRYWAYFDETGKLRMYEDELINRKSLTRVDGEGYWRLSTEEEIAQYDAAADGEKPEHIVKNVPYRIRLEEDGTYKAEPLDLGWVVTNRQDGQTPYESNVVENDSRYIHVPAGWTVVRFGQNARSAVVPGFNAIEKWTADFADLIVANSDKKMEFKYVDPKAKFNGITNLDGDKDLDGVQIVIGNEVLNITEAVLGGVTSTYVTKENDILSAGNGTIFDYADFSLEISDGEEVLETLEIKYNKATKEYEVPEVTKIDTSEFGKEYNLAYKSSTPVNKEETVFEATVVIGTVNPEILGLEKKYGREGSSINLYDGITAKDPDGKDITSNITITHEDNFNPNYLTYGNHVITVTLNWLYESIAPNTFKFPVTVDETQKEWKFDVKENNDKSLINFNYENPSESDRIPTIYDHSLVDEIIKDKTKVNFTKENGTTLIFDKAGVLVTKLDTFKTDATPQVLKDGKVENLPQDYDYKEWITDYLVRGSYLLHTQGSDDSKETQLMKVGEKLVDFLFFEYFSQEVTVVKTFEVEVSDVTPPRVRVLSKNFTIYTDNNFENVQEALYSNIEVFEINGYTMSISQVASRIDIHTSGEHNVEVTVTDLSGNSVTVRFKLIIKDVYEVELPETGDDLDETVKDLEEQLQDALDKIDSKTTLTMVLVISLVSLVLSIGTTVILVFVKKN